MGKSKRSSGEHHHTYLSLLKLSLWAGAAYDVVFAFAMVVFPVYAAELLGLRLPGEPFYLWLIAVFLLMLAAIYLFAAYDPQAYRGNILVGIVGRSVGFLVLIYAAITAEPPMPGLYLAAFGDLTFAVCHAVFWWPIRK